LVYSVTCDYSKTLIQARLLLAGLEFKIYLSYLNVAEVLE